MKNKKNKKLYTYFISYIFYKKEGWGWSNATIKKGSKISTYEDIKEVEEAILEESGECEKVLIQNLVLL